MTVNVSRAPYFREIRRQRKEEAEIIVSEFWGRPRSCFSCGVRSPLTFDHLVYEKDSVRFAHSNSRILEARNFPERFRLLCWPCHLREEIQKAAKNGLMFDASSGGGIRASITMEKWRLAKLKATDERREGWAKQLRFLNEIQALWGFKPYKYVDDLKRQMRKAHAQNIKAALDELREKREEGGFAE